jgi:hypothetical protein
MTDIIDRIIESCTDTSTYRLRVRRTVPPTREEVIELIQQAARTGATYHAWHGGSVANKYGYPAQTECVGMAAIRVGDLILVWASCGRIAANKATTTGALCGALGMSRRGPWWTWASGRRPACGRRAMPLPAGGWYYVIDVGAVRPWCEREIAE